MTMDTSPLAIDGNILARKAPDQHVYIRWDVIQVIPHITTDYFLVDISAIRPTGSCIYLVSPHNIEWQASIVFSKKCKITSKT